MSTLWGLFGSANATARVVKETARKTRRDVRAIELDQMRHAQAEAKELVHLKAAIARADEPAMLRHASRVVQLQRAIRECTAQITRIEQTSFTVSTSSQIVAQTKDAVAASKTIKRLTRAMPSESAIKTAARSVATSAQTIERSRDASNIIATNVAGISDATCDITEMYEAPNDDDDDDDGDAPARDVRALIDRYRFAGAPTPPIHIPTAHRRGTPLTNA
jgi:hypothetical protein